MGKERKIRMLADNVPVLIAYFDATRAALPLRQQGLRADVGLERASRSSARRCAEIIGDEGYREIAPHIERVRRGRGGGLRARHPGRDGRERVLEVNLLPQRDARRAHRGRVRAHQRHHAPPPGRAAGARERGAAAQVRRRHPTPASSSTRAAFSPTATRRSCSLTGYTYDELIGTQIIQYVVARAARRGARDNVRIGYERPYESEIVAKDGTRIPVEFEGRVMPYGRARSTAYRWSATSASARRAEARIDFLAHHDLLTGLPNRALLLDRLEFILAAARRRGRPRRRCSSSTSTTSRP